MRDVATVDRGEHVVIRNGDTVTDTGVYVGFVNQRIVVDTGRAIVNVLPDAAPLTVEDAAGRILGVVAEDPDLTGAHPERE